MKSLFLKLVFASIVIAFSSCNKNDDNNPLPNPTPIPQPVPLPPAKNLVEFKNGEEFIRFEYDVAGKIKKAIVSNKLISTGQPTNYEVIFHQDGNLAGLFANNGERIEPVYEDDVLIRANYYYDNQRQGYTNFYFENGQLKIATLYNLLGGDFEPFFEFRYEYNVAGNVTERVTMMTNGVPGHMVRAGKDSYDYDEKASPLYAQKELLAILWQSASKNNVKFEREYDAVGNIQKETFLNYSYNAAGQPLSAAIKIQAPGEPEENKQVTFTYE
jgi:hypothetical protein